MAVLGVGVLAFAAGATPPSNEGGELIAFMSIRTGDPHIYVQSEGVDRQITAGPGVHTHPALAFDGRVAYVKSVGGQGKVFMTNADGSNPRRLTQANRIESSPSWSPDGRYLAIYSSDPSKAGIELHIVELATGSTVVIGADGRDKGPTAPTWSADGSRLAFPGTDAKGRIQVFAVQRDGSGLVDLSSSFNDRNKFGAQISPDGTRVAFTADVRQRRPLLVAEIATGKIVELTPERDAAYEMARWSPDGKQLAVVRSAEPGVVDSRNEVFVMSATGEELRNVSRHPAEDFDPQWASDGRSIVFASLRTGTSQLFKADLVNGKTQSISRGHRSHDMDHVLRAVPH